MRFPFEKEEHYVKKVFKNSIVLGIVICFIDRTTRIISIQKNTIFLEVVYNSNKSKHDLKFQAVNEPDGFILHVAGTVEGRDNAWTLYIRTDLV